MTTPETATIVVFTAKSVESMVRLGGTGSWRLDRNNARQCTYVVCTRNGNAEWVEGNEVHQSAFLIGRVSDVVPSQEPGYEDRYVVKFSEYALINEPSVWKGDRNPVKYYATLREIIGIDPATLEWKQVPQQTELPQSEMSRVNITQPLSLAEAKRGLALTFGVSPESIEITIRG